MKSIQHYIPLYFTILLSVGIVLGFYFPFSFAWLVPILVVLLSLLILLYRPKHLYSNTIFSLVALVAFLFLGIVLITFQKPIHQKLHFSHRIPEQKITSFRITDKLKPNTNNFRYKAQILTINRQPVRGSVILYLPKTQTELAFENTYVAPLNFQTVKPPLHPYGFNYRDYLKKQNIDYQAYIGLGGIVEVTPSSFNLPIRAKVWREKILEKIDLYPFGTHEKSILTALILGDKLDLSDEVKTAYTQVGAIHILAISGLHIGMLYAMLGWIFGFLPRNNQTKVYKILLILMLLWGYALLVGMGSSVVRAVTMFSFVGIAQVYSQKIQVIHSLIVSFLFLLVIHPYYLFDVGFQLSYTAVLGIIWFYPLIYNSLPFRKNKVWVYFWQLISVSVAATLGTFPLTLFYFHQFPLLFVIANIVLVPLSGIVLFGGIIFILLTLLLRVPDFVVSILDFIIKVMNRITYFLSEIEMSTVQHIHFPWLYIPFSYVIILFLMHFWHYKTYFNVKRMLWSVMGFQIVVLYTNLNQHQQNEWGIWYQKKGSIITYKQGKSLYVLTNQDSLIKKKPLFLEAYQTALNIEEITIQKLKSPYLQCNQQIVYVIDSLGIYQNVPLKPNVVLLTQSPKIHFEQMIIELKPQKLIADATNQRFLVEKWKNTAQKYNLDFYCISEKGTYIEWLP